MVVNIVFLLIFISIWFAIQILRCRSKIVMVKLTLSAISLVSSTIFVWSLLTVVESLLDTDSSLPHGMVQLFAVLTFEWIGWLYVTEQATSAVKISMPFLFRVAILALLFVLLCNPVKKNEVKDIQTKQVAIYLDDSLSMELPGNRDAKTEMTRKEIARRILFGGKGGPNGSGLLKTLARDYGVRLFRFANSSREDVEGAWADINSQLANKLSREEAEKDFWRHSTHLSESASDISEATSLDQLSSVVFLTDGCDRSIQEPVLDELARRKIPVHSILIGDTGKITDAEVMFLRTPSQVFLGDELTVRAALKADGLLGRRLRVRLFENGIEKESTEVSVTQSKFRKTIRFQTKPEAIGPYEYEVVIDPIEGDEFPENNRSSSTVWVSKDSIHLLIIENRPRWEFRYLRNLFAGRDKSVYLQWLLLRPDRVEELGDPPILEASASRAFDDCEATVFPSDEKEWMKFDAVVLGDVSPEDLGQERMEILNRFVKKKGGSLIVISGKKSMPAAYKGTSLQPLLPVNLSGKDSKVSEEGYFLQVGTPSASSNMMDQSEDARESVNVWNELPRLYWRHWLSEAKPGASVLAYWVREKEKKLSHAEKRSRALILWHRFGAGKVLQMNFDQTWRLRYGIGDRRHHRFWAQVCRWAVSDRLPIGTELVRLGLDRSVVDQGQEIRVRCRLLDGNRNPVTPKSVRINVYQDGKLLQSVSLSETDDGVGFSNGVISGIKEPGKYQVRLEGSEINRLLALEGKSDTKIETDLIVKDKPKAKEWNDLVADSTICSQMATRTGGKVVSPENTQKLMDQFGEKSRYVHRKWETPLWNHWSILASVVFLLGMEWTVRRVNGLI